MNHVVLVGNPVDGLRLFGPFDGAEAANEWADTVDGEWWVVELAEPQP